VLDICRGKHSGSRGHAGKGYVRAAVPALAAIAAAGLCLASPGTASAAESTAQPPAGAALAWGDNTYGELGNGTTTNSPVPVAVDLPTGVRVTAVSANANFSLALTSAGRVLAWGENDLGELGDGTSGAPSATPVPVDLPAGTRVTAISAGGSYSLAVTSTGSVLAWGFNNYGQLGNGTSGGYSPVPVAVKLPARIRVTAVAAGGGYSLALTSTGSVLAWGYAGTTSITPIPVDLPAGTRVTAVTSGGNDSLALTSAGNILAWGQNDYGQLGDGSTTNSPVPVAVDLPAGTRATAIAAGYTQSLAVTSTGSVLAWGYNAHGELGDGTIGAPSATPVPVDLPAGTRVTAIADAGQGLAMTSTGSVLTWGYNYHGDLGDGSTANSSTPVPVDLPAGTSVVAIAAGGGGNSLAVAVHRSC
jgi:alpha-tubulin suppressor-like RCC1 family protein